MQKYRQTVTDSAGNIVPLATITVYDTGTLDIATPIYSDDGITTESNPFTTGSNGIIEFYAPDAKYDIKISKSGFNTQTDTDKQFHEDISGVEFTSNVEAPSFTINGVPVSSSTDTYFSVVSGGDIQYLGGTTKINLLAAGDADMGGFEILDSKTISEMQRGKGLRFNGVDQEVTIADDPNLDFGTDDFSIVIIARLGDASSGAEVLAQKGSSPFWLLQQTTGNKLEFNANGGTTITVESDSTVNNKLLSIVITGDRSGLTKMFLRGKVQADTETTPTGTLSNANSLFFGQSNGGGSKFGGELFHVLLFNHALSETDAKSWGATASLKQPEFKDIGGSQVAQNVSTCVNVSYDTFDGASATGFHAIHSTAGTQRAGTVDEIAWIKGKTFRFPFTAALTSGAAPFFVARDFIGGSDISDTGSQVVISGVNFITITPTVTTTGVIEFLSFTNGEYTISDLDVKQIGCIAEYRPDTISTDKWYDAQNGNDGIHDADVINDFSTRDGTFTPTVTFGGGNGDLSYTTQFGSSKRNNDYAVITGNIKFSQTTASGVLVVSDLPFISKNVSDSVVPVVLYVSKIGAAGKVITGRLFNNGTSFTLKTTDQGTAASGNVSNAECSTTDCEILFQVTYPIE